jgi:hypothetical protein
MESAKKTLRALKQSKVGKEVPAEFNSNIANSDMGSAGLSLRIWLTAVLITSSNYDTELELRILLTLCCSMYPLISGVITSSSYY